MTTFTSKKPRIRRRYFVLGVIVYVLIFEAYYALQWSAMKPMPEDAVYLPQVDTVIDPPMRPGVDGIWIAGAPVKQLVFEINPFHPGTRDLIWQDLPQNTRVKIRCHVDAYGYLVMDNYEIEGHPAAGMKIVEAMRTWKYNNLKRGIINFDFKLPSKSEKLTIHTRLIQNPVFPDSMIVFDGQLHNIQGIDRSEFKVERM